MPDLSPLVAALVNLLDTLPALVGVALGWGLKTWSDSRKERRAREGEFKRAMAALLAYRSQLATVRPTLALMRRLTERQGTEIREAARQETFRSALDRINRLSARLESAITTVAGLDPFLAERLLTVRENNLGTLTTKLEAALGVADAWEKYVDADLLLLEAQEGLVKTVLEALAEPCGIDSEELEEELEAAAAQTELLTEAMQRGVGTPQPQTG